MRVRSGPSRSLNVPPRAWKVLAPVELGEHSIAEARNRQAHIRRGRAGIDRDHVDGAVVAAGGCADARRGLDLHRFDRLQQRGLEPPDLLDDAADRRRRVDVPVRREEREAARARDREPALRANRRRVISTPGVVPQRIPRTSIHGTSVAGRERLELLLRVEVDREQLSAAELLQRIEVEADDVGLAIRPG